MIFIFTHKIRNDCTIKTLHNDSGAHRLATTVSATHHGRDEARLLNCCLASPRRIEQWRFINASEPNVSITNFSFCQIFFGSLFFNCLSRTNIRLAPHNGKKIRAGYYFFFICFLFKIYFLPSRSTTATTLSWFPSDSLRRNFHCDGDRFCTKRTPKRIKEREWARDTQQWCSCLVCSSVDAAPVDADKNTSPFYAVDYCVLFSSLSSPFVLNWCDCARSQRHTVYMAMAVQKKPNRIGQRTRENRTHTYMHTCAFGKWKWRWFVCIVPSARVCAVYACCCFGGGCGWGRPIEIENFSFMQSHRFSHSVWTNEAEVSSHRYRHSVRCTYFLSK